MTDKKLTNTEKGFMEGFLRGNKVMLDAMQGISPNEYYNEKITLLYNLLVRNLNDLDYLSDSLIATRAECLHNLEELKNDLDRMREFSYTTMEGVFFKRIYAKDLHEKRLDEYLLPIRNFIEDVETEIEFK